MVREPLGVLVTSSPSEGPIEARFEKPIAILMVDPDVEDVELIRQSFELAGLPAVLSVAASGEEALLRLGRVGPHASAPMPDVILACLRLPGLSGADLVRQVRANKATRKLPVIMIGGSASADERQTAKDLGADHILDKPEDDAGFFGVIAAIKFFWMSKSFSSAPPLVSMRPLRLSGIDLMALPLEPAEAYIVSLLDGEIGVDDISTLIGAPARETRGMLRRLADLGAVAWDPPHPSLWPPAAPSIAAPAPVSEVEKEALQSAAETPFGDPTESGAGEKRTLDTGSRLVIDQTYELIGEGNHYELLGVATDATKAEIRSSYYRLAKLFHPDSRYTWDLGSYQRKMERIFQAVTDAYATLGKKKTRRAYDEYLGIVVSTEGIERALSRPAMQAVVPKAVNEVVSPAAPVSPKPAAPVRATPKPDPATQTTAGKRAVGSAGRKKVKSSGEAGATTPVVKGAAPHARSAVVALARTLNQMSARMRGVDRASRLIADAKTAEAEGNFIGAANAMRMASQWRPDDAKLGTECERLTQAALVSNVGQYERRAQYEETNSMWKEAAVSWARVHRARPRDSKPAHKAASMILKSNGNIREATELARHAIECSPRCVESRIVLAEAYMAGAMIVSAKRQLEIALEIEPTHERAQALLLEIG